MRNKIILSKTKLKQNDQCEKMLWLEINKRDVGVWDSSDQSKFTQGRDVEKIVRDLFNGGVLMDAVANEDKIKLTNKLLAQKTKVIFEASFVAENTIVQFDVLFEKPDGTFGGIEVKSGGSFKPDYLDDTTIQYFITEKSGKVKLSSYEVWFINKSAQSSDPNELFTKVDVMDQIKNNKPRFDKLLQSALETHMLKLEPKKTLGHQCSKPYSCKFWNYCTQNVNQNPDSVLNLPYFPNKYQALAKGIDSINHPEFDKNYKYVENNPMVALAIKENRIVLNQEGIVKDISAWKYPLNFFDFEALTAAVPILKGQKPFDQMVFQYSAHKLEQDMKVVHYEFLHETLENPSEAVIESMLKTLDNEGSIVSYNQTYEKTRIKDLAKSFPKYAIPLMALLDRFVDLMDIVKDHVYHPSFKGSYSLKVVSPVLLGKENGGYTDSIITSGSEIAKYYIEFLTTTDPERRTVLKEALLKYCKYDTTNLVLLMMWLLDQKVDLKDWINKTVIEVVTLNKVA